MRFKLDENLGLDVAEVLRCAEHDVTTVVGQRLGGSADRDLIGVCRAEARCLVTLDLDFGNPLLFRHADYAGVALLRPPTPITAAALLRLAERLRDALHGASIDGKLWIVQVDRVREYQAPDADE